MSQLSFIATCIEHYAAYVNKPSNEVYSLFRDSGLLDMLKDDYEDLHGMGIEYMVNFCDQYLNGGIAI